MLAAFKGCHQKGYYEFLEAISPEGTSPHLHAGGALAEGFEAARIAHWGPEKLPPPAALAAGIRALTMFYGEYVPPEAGTAANKTWEHCVLALASYFDEYGWDTDAIQPMMMASGNPAVEFRFAEPIDIPHPESGEPLILCGRFDMFGISREYGGALYIVDEKTTSQLGFSWSKQWDLRSQFIQYTWAARRNDFPVLGAIVRGIGMLKHETSHAQAILQIPKWKVDQWFELTCIHLERIIEAWKAGYWLKQYDDTCNSYGGCAYKPLCDTPSPEKWRDSYVIRRWDPLAVDPTHTAKQPLRQGFAAIAPEEPRLASPDDSAG